MPHVSKRKIKKEQFEKIYKKLADVFDNAGKNKKSKLILDEFLTSTEKVMLAKRLAVIFMLNENISIHHISEALFVSSSTVNRISLKYDTGKFAYMSEIAKNNKADVWDILKTLILIGLTPKVGKNRWKWFYEIDKKYYK
ncbi:MAG: helix-turn-helix domain-containing protein [Candidatus Paceibacterota bacterium]|jgi:Trp operon repressor